MDMRIRDAIMARISSLNLKDGDVLPIVHKEVLALDGNFNDRRMVVNGIVLVNYDYNTHLGMLGDK